MAHSAPFQLGITENNLILYYPVVKTKHTTFAQTCYCVIIIFLISVKGDEQKYNFVNKEKRI